MDLYVGDFQGSRSFSVRKIYGSKGSLKLTEVAKDPKVSQRITKYPKIPIATKVPKVTKVPLATKVIMATKVPSLPMVTKVSKGPMAEKGPRATKVSI